MQLKNANAEKCTIFFFYNSAVAKRVQPKREGDGGLIKLPMVLVFTRLKQTKYKLQIFTRCLETGPNQSHFNGLCKQS